jgi:hypothetical protein
MRRRVTTPRRLVAFSYAETQRSERDPDRCIPDDSPLARDERFSLDVGAG